MTACHAEAAPEARHLLLAGKYLQFLLFSAQFPQDRLQRYTPGRELERVSPASETPACEHLATSPRLGGGWLDQSAQGGTPGSRAEKQWCLLNEASGAVGLLRLVRPAPPQHVGGARACRDRTWAPKLNACVALKSFPVWSSGYLGCPGGNVLAGCHQISSCRGTLPQARASGKPNKAISGKMLPGLGLTPGPSSSPPQAKWFPKVPAKPVVALKTPIKVELVAGKTYRWCVCGRSKKQVRDPHPTPPTDIG